MICIADSKRSKNQLQSIALRNVGLILGMALVLLLSSCGGGSEGEAPITPTSPPPTPEPITLEQMLDTSRFTASATFGMTYSQIESIARQGKENWVETEFTKPASSHQSIVDQLFARREAGEFEAFEEDIEVLTQFRRLAWWHQTIRGEDALRQRIAFALSQIFVVSDNVDALIVYPYALSNYYDMLAENAFGNFRDLLRNVTLHPAMGIYLSHVNNRKGDLANNTFPDENFAREVMQLFSIGLFELNVDGSLKTDNIGNPLATYTNVDIREFAKIFTGMSYGGPDSHFANGDPFFRAPMEMFNEQHEPGQKLLLNNVVVAAGQDGIQDVEDAIDNLFNHANVGPFIGKQLIQRLTTSNPSNAYVERVAQAFNGDISGVRGDMQAVIRAILFDAEATSAPDIGSSFGKLREPVVRYASILRQFNANTSDGFIFNTGYALQFLSRQHPLSAPSVFNFYLPTHMPSGNLAEAGLVAPEFEITTSTTVIGMSNLVDAVIGGDFVTDVEEPFERAVLDLDEYIDLAPDITALMDQLDVMLTYGTLSDDARTAIENILIDVDDMNFRVRIAIYLILISPDYAIQI